MKYFLTIIYFLLLLGGLVSCKTDFDVIASYKEITVVYGLLDQKDTTHYLRISKAFLGEGNALTYAKEPDSNIYGSELSVSLREIRSATDFETITFDTITIHNKDSGIFFSPDQKMYKSDAILNPDYSYELQIVNTKSGNEVTSYTNLIKSFSLINPKPGSKKIGFSRDILSAQKIEWKSSINGRRYQPIIKFFFIESSSPNDSIMREIDWLFPSYTSSGIDGGEEMWATYLNEDFYDLCETQIPYSDPIKEDSVRIRLADHFEIIFVIVGDEFSTYLDLNGPTSGLLLERPVYSNITNGVGVFSCHFQWSKSYQVNEITKAALQNTTDLHFFAN